MPPPRSCSMKRQKAPWTNEWQSSIPVLSPYPPGDFGDILMETRILRSDRIVLALAGINHTRLHKMRKAKLGKVFFSQEQLRRQAPAYRLHPLWAVDIAHYLRQVTPSCPTACSPHRLAMSDRGGQVQRQARIPLPQRPRCDLRRTRKRSRSTKFLVKEQHAPFRRGGKWPTHEHQAQEPGALGQPATTRCDDA